MIVPKIGGDSSDLFCFWVGPMGIHSPHRSQLFLGTGYPTLNAGYIYLDKLEQLTDLK